MKRGTLVIIIVAVALLGLVVAVAASFLHDGLSSRATPTKFEITLARNARRLAIPSNARLAQNPVLDSPEDLRDARLHFADHCAICHANDGSGQSMIGGGLYPKPPDLRLPETQNLTDGELFWIVENGVRFTGMPAFSNGGEHGGMQGSWKLVHFIRHLPHLSVAERIEMERYNPKGPDDRAEEQQENDFLNGATRKRKPESQDHHLE
ncbi:MAG TPA: cytochrome c [Candidatus Eisenbacteria bacterium]|jgi:mono/diheme cytochrome c family protein|nr:cytochrome c [Candidatus Eisenbacteria bacterium]